MFLPTAFLLLLITSTISSTPLTKTTDDIFKLIILHNNDMHARFEQTNAMSSRCKEDDEKNNHCYGGFARVAHEVRRYRDKAARREIPKVLYLNAGDTYTGTPWFALYKENITAAFLKLLKPDAISLGNHEFDEGAENLGKFLKEVDFPVLAANLNIDKEPSLKVDVLKPSHIFEIEGTKIGVIGYLTPETKGLAISNEVEFTDEIEAINAEAAILKAAGINIIIALGHSGIERDKQIAHECPDIDLVIGGHSHTFLYTGPQPDSDVPYDTYPVTVIQHNGRRVPVVQSYAYTKYLGYLHLEFDGEGEILEIDGTPILLNGTIERDADVLALLDVYRPGVLELQNEVVGFTRVHLEGSCRRQECNLANFIADGMVDWNALKHSGEGWTDAAIGIIQGGGVRASIEKTSDGKITKEDVQTVLPFESKVVVIEVTGAVLLASLEHSVSRYTEGEGRGEFLQYSGLQVEYDMNNESGKRVTKVKVLCAYCQVPEHEDIDLSKKYRIVLQDFLADGGDGFEMFKNTQIKESETLDIDVFDAFIKKKSPIYPPIEWRITIRDVIDPSQEIVGSTKVFLDGNCYRSECNLGNFITDSIVDLYAFSFAQVSGWTDASIALIPASNIRHSIDHKERDGQISKADAMNVLPIDQKIAVLDVKGGIIKDALEHAVKRLKDGEQPSEFLQMSGMHVEYNANNPANSRVISVKVLCSDCPLPELQDLDISKDYKLLVPENLANGSDGYSMLPAHIAEVLEFSELDAFVRFLKKKSPVYPAVEWRITIKNYVDPSEDVVGQTRVYLDKNCTHSECNLGNFIADSMVDWYAMRYDKDDFWTDASIAVFQGSRIGYSIDPKVTNGSIFRTDVEKIFQPSSFNLHAVTLKGGELRDLLEYSMSTVDDGSVINNEFLQVSGIQVTYDLNKPSGSRIISIKVLCAQCSRPELENLDANKNYKVIMQSVMVSDDYHNVITSNINEDLHESDVNAFLQLLKKKSPIHPAVEWRITLIPKTDTATQQPSSALTLQESSLMLIATILIYYNI